MKEYIFRTKVNAHLRKKDGVENANNIVSFVTPDFVDLYYDKLAINHLFSAALIGKDVLRELSSERLKNNIVGVSSCLANKDWENGLEFNVKSLVELSDLDLDDILRCLSSSVEHQLEPAVRTDINLILPEFNEDGTDATLSFLVDLNIKKSVGFPLKMWEAELDAKETTKGFDTWVNEKIVQEISVENARSAQSVKSKAVM